MGVSDIEGKGARVAPSEAGAERVSITRIKTDDDKTLKNKTPGGEKRLDPPGAEIYEPGHE